MRRKLPELHHRRWQAVGAMLLRPCPWPGKSLEEQTSYRYNALWPGTQPNLSSSTFSPLVTLGARALAHHLAT